MTSPNGGEAWALGQTNFIQWSDNISENVAIDLYKGATLITSSYQQHGGHRRLRLDHQRDQCSGHELFDSGQQLNQRGRLWNQQPHRSASWLTRRLSPRSRQTSPSSPATPRSSAPRSPARSADVSLAAEWDQSRQWRQCFRRQHQRAIARLGDEPATPAIIHLWRRTLTARSPAALLL